MRTSLIFDKAEWKLLGWNNFLRPTQILWQIGCHFAQLCDLCSMLVDAMSSEHIGNLLENLTRWTSLHTEKISSSSHTKPHTVLHLNLASNYTSGCGAGWATISAGCNSSLSVTFFGKTQISFRFARKSYCSVGKLCFLVEKCPNWE